MRRSTSQLYRRLRDGPIPGGETLQPVIPTGVAVRLAREAAENERPRTRAVIYDQFGETEETRAVKHDSAVDNADRTNLSDRVRNFMAIAAPAVIIGTGLTFLTGLSDANGANFGYLDDLNLREQGHDPNSVEGQMSTIASDYTGNDGLEVFCSETNSYSTTGQIKKGIGVVGLYFSENITSSGEPTILISHSLCDSLENPQHHLSSVVAGAVLAFSHEVGHATGEDDEGIANCLGVELYDQFNESLALTNYTDGVDPSIIASRLPEAKYHTAGC